MRDPVQRFRLSRLRLALGFFLLSQVSLSSEPVVRIGIGRDLQTLTVTSSAPFLIEGVEARTAHFTTVISIGSAEGVLSASDLVRRMAIDLGDDRLLVRPMDARVRIVPGEAPLAFDTRRWRGEMEVIGNVSGSMTLVNELPLETYLLGVVPNELGPEVFPELEALKAQAIAARTYIVRNLGQFASQGFDICATDQCQVYFGMDTEHEMATRAIAETRARCATCAFRVGKV
jgi:stage II sporulation protein D